MPDPIVDDLPPESRNHFHKRPKGTAKERYDAEQKSKYEALTPTQKKIYDKIERYRANWHENPDYIILDRGTYDQLVEDQKVNYRASIKAIIP